MPSLTFVMPHWLYWAGLILFPLMAMAIVKRQGGRPATGAVSLPLAYLFWITAGFLGIHRLYLRSLLGLVYIPLFVLVLMGNAQVRDARLFVSNARGEVMSTEFLLERAQENQKRGEEGAAQKVVLAEEALNSARVARVTAAEDFDRRERNSGWLAVLIGLLLLADGMLLPRLVRRAAEREPATVETESQMARTLEAGSREDRIPGWHTPFTDIIDQVSEFSGKFVAYWSLIAVFVYYYEVIARYVFNSPTNWAHESMFLMFGMQYLLSGAYTFRVGAHVRVDVLFVFFPKRVKVIVDIVTSVFFFLFTVALLWTGFIFARDAVEVFEVSFTEWAIQYWPVKITIVLGALLLVAQGVSKLLKDIALLRVREA